MSAENRGYVPPEAMPDNNSASRDEKEKGPGISRRDALKMIGGAAAGLGVTAAMENSTLAAMLKNGKSAEQQKQPEQKEKTSKYKIEVFGTNPGTKENVVNIIGQYVERATKDGKVRATAEQLASIRGGQTLVAVFGEFAIPQATVDSFRRQAGEDERQVEDRTIQDTKNRIPTGGAGSQAKQAGVNLGIDLGVAILRKGHDAKKEIQGPAKVTVTVPYKLGMGGSGQTDSDLRVECTYDPQKHQYNFKSIKIGYSKQEKEYPIPTSLGAYFAEQQNSNSNDPHVESIKERIKRLVVQFAVDDAERGAHTVLGKALQEFAVSAHKDIPPKKLVRERPGTPVDNEKSITPPGKPAQEQGHTQEDEDNRPTRTRAPIPLPTRRRN